MIFGKYDFICKFQKNAVLPDYKGSTFHGVFGRALKAVVCVLKQRTCKECPLINRCLYVRIFETQLIRKPQQGSKISDVPNPYVILPPLNFDNHFEKDKTLSCSLLLFGQINMDLPYFIYAFDRMGKTGLGRRVNGSRGRFSLIEVKSGKTTIYTEKDKRIELSQESQSLTLPKVNGQKNAQVNLTLVTPLRVKYNQRVATDLPFHVLARAMLRRMSSLLDAYGEGQPNLDYGGMIQKALAVETEKKDLSWYDWERYSFRQKQRMPMGGLVGTISYKNVPAEFLPVFEFCEKVNIGKNTTFGLGKIALDIVN